MSSSWCRIDYLAVVRHTAELCNRWPVGCMQQINITRKKDIIKQGTPLVCNSWWIFFVGLHNVSWASDLVSETRCRQVKTCTLQNVMFSELFPLLRFYFCSVTLQYVCNWWKCLTQPYPIPSCRQTCRAFFTQAEWSSMVNLTKAYAQNWTLHNVIQLSSSWYEFFQTNGWFNIGLGLVKHFMPVLISVKSLTS